MVFLDLTPEQAQARGGWGGEVYEKAEMQRRVRELFRGIGGLQDVSDAVKRDESVRVVDAGGSVEAVAEGIWGLAEGVVGSVDRGERGAVRSVQ